MARTLAAWLASGAVALACGSACVLDPSGLAGDSQSTTTTAAGGTANTGGADAGTTSSGAAGGAVTAGGGGAGGSDAGLGASGGQGGGAGSGGASPVLPITTGLIMHLDAYDASSFALEGGAAVARWQDSSGSAKDFVFPAGTRGTFVGSGTGPQNYYDNRGTGIPTPPSFVTRPNEFSFTAWLDPVQTGYHCVYDNNSTKPMLWYDPSNGWEVDIDDLQGVPDPPGAFGSVAVVNRNVSPYLRELYVDGVSKLTHTLASYHGTALNVSWLRRQGWATQISVAKWKEILLYDRGLTSDEVAAIHAYFVAKWQ